MKIKKILLTLILSVLWCGVLFAQNIVKDTNNVRKPIVGKLYYQKTDNNLYLFRNGFELVDLYPENIVVPPDTSIIEPPIPGDGNALKSDIPKFVWVWGFFSGKIEQGNLESNRVHYAEQSAMSDSRFREQRPFYAKDIPSTKVKVGYKYDQSQGKWLFDERIANTDWQMTQKECDQSIDYLIKSGLQYFNFIYYPNGNDGGIFRNFFEQSTNKRGVKAAYTIGLLGGNPKDYPNENDDYTKNIRHFVWALNQDWYQKIDGKPIVFYYSTEEETKINLQRVRQLYGKEMYEVYVESGFGTDYRPVVNNGMDARSWYYVYNPESNGSHKISTVIDETIAGTNQIISNNFEVVPTFTIALDQRARQNYPYDGVQYDRPGYEGFPNSYYNWITLPELNRYFTYGTELEKSKKAFVKTYGFANFDEMSEAADTLMPKKNNDGSINSRMVNWFGNYYYSITR